MKINYQDMEKWTGVDVGSAWRAKMAQEGCDWLASHPNQDDWTAICGDTLIHVSRREGAYEVWECRIRSHKDFAVPLPIKKKRRAS